MLERDKKSRKKKTEIEGLWDEILPPFTSQLLSLSLVPISGMRTLCVVVCSIWNREREVEHHVRGTCGTNMVYWEAASCLVSLR